MSYITVTNLVGPHLNFDEILTYSMEKFSTFVLPLNFFSNVKEALAKVRVNFPKNDLLNCCNNLFWPGKNENLVN